MKGLFRETQGKVQLEFEKICKFSKKQTPKEAYLTAQMLLEICKQSTGK